MLLTADKLLLKWNELASFAKEFKVQWFVHFFSSSKESRFERRTVYITDEVAKSVSTVLQEDIWT